MIPLYRSAAPRNAAIVVAVLMTAIGFLPLFGGPGYEHSLASGLVVPSAAAIATALELSAIAACAPLAAVGRGILCGLWLAAVSFATALVHGLRAGVCDLPAGALEFALTAGVGAVLGGVWGAVVAEIARRRTRRKLAAVLLALAAPIACVVASLLRFYTSPMIFAFDPFAGYFSGALYDTIIETGMPLVMYRVGSLATLSFVLFTASLLERSERGTLRFVPIRGSVAATSRALLAAIALATSVAITASGPALGHWQTAASIERALGARRDGPRCTVIHPDSLRDDEAALLLKDCEEEIASDEEYLEIKGDARVTAFFFRDTSEKKRLMGASDTSIAKPWRREVYVQLSGYPHPVLGHEIAHALSGTFAPGPMHVAGKLGGVLPNPGLIEGIAVATSPDDDELTDEQWARAMMDLKILPPMRQVFSMEFLGQNSAKSYTIAGAFVRFVKERWGAKAVREWYGGGDLESLTGQSWDALDAAFRDKLSTLVLSNEVDAYAKARFERPSVFGRTCPHVIDAWKREAQRCEGEHRIARAASLFEQVLARDPHDANARVSLGSMLVRYGDAARGAQELDRVLSDGKAPRTAKDRAEETLADRDLMDGRFDDAEKRYRALADRTLDEDQARTLEVKALAANDLPARRAVIALLLGGESRAPDPFVGALWLGVWDDQARSPLADYLIGRNLAQHQWYALSATFLDRALASPSPTARVARELVRQRGIVACAERDRAALDRVRQIVASASSPFKGTAGGRLEWIERLLARCRVD